MKPLPTRLLVSALLVLVLAAPAAAQIDGVSVMAETVCDGYDVEITVTFHVFDTIPANVVGWMLIGEVLGDCIEDYDIGEVRVLPTELGDHVVVIQDRPVVPNRKVIYHIRAVTDTGDRELIYWPRRSWFAQTHCTWDVTARGTVIDYFGNPYLSVCPDECWWEMSYFDGHFPPDQELPPYGATVDIYGEIFNGMEGPYIRATHWVYAPAECRAVPNESTNWGTLKALYR